MHIKVCNMFRAPVIYRTSLPVHLLAWRQPTEDHLPHGRSLSLKPSLRFTYATSNSEESKVKASLFLTWPFS